MYVVLYQPKLPVPYVEMLRVVVVSSFFSFLPAIFFVGDSSAVLHSCNSHWAQNLCRNLRGKYWELKPIFASENNNSAGTVFTYDFLWDREPFDTTRAVTAVECTKVYGILRGYLFGVEFVSLDDRNFCLIDLLSGSGVVSEAATVRTLKNASFISKPQKCQKMSGNRSQRTCKRKASEMSVNSDDTEHRVAKMIRAEAAFRTVQNISRLSYCNNQVWREQVAQWCYDVVDHLDASREAVYVAMNVLDRYLAETSSSSTPIDKVEYERIAITSFFLALRITTSIEIRIPDILSLSRSSMQPRDILSTGSRILECLTWSNRILTPHSFLKAFMGLRSRSLNQTVVASWFDLAVYLVEISACDGNFSSAAASEIALGAIIVAMKKSRDYEVHKQDCDALVREIFVHSSIDPSSESLRTVCVRLQNIYNQSQESPQTDSPHVIEADDEDENSDSCQTTQSSIPRVTSVSRPISPFQEKEC